MDAEDEIQKILRAAGIGSAPMDPSSIASLKKLVNARQCGSVEFETPTPSSVKSSPTTGTASAPATNNSTTDTMEWSSFAVSSGARKGQDTVDQTQVLELLKHQTELLVETQRKLDALTAKVDAMCKGFDPTLSGDFIGTRTRQYGKDSGERVDEDNGDMTKLSKFAEAQPQPDGETDRIENRARALPAGRNGAGQFPIVRIARLFWNRSVGFVVPIDGGLIFKLVFMLLVMTARVSRSPAAASGHRFYVTVTMMVLGFLYHTRYLQFMYQFVWVDNIPFRVFAGEDVEDERNQLRGNRDVARPERIPVPPQHQRNQEAGRIGGLDPGPNAGRVPGGWNRNFIVGGIQPRQQNRNFVLSFVQDIFYLIGSFVFSIFPMWQPEGPPHRARDGHENVALHNFDRGAEEPDAIPQVAPPLDAMEPVDDESD